VRSASCDASGAGADVATVATGVTGRISGTVAVSGIRGFDIAQQLRLTSPLRKASVCTQQECCCALTIARHITDGATVSSKSIAATAHLDNLAQVTIPLCYQPIQVVR
jgi:hypothetical protein